MICTFYSFKGGVGRSMALANIAELFYDRGLKVLMVDFDLEAPGLERYFALEGEALTTVQSHRGVVDMVHSFLELQTYAAESGAAAGADAPFSAEPVENFILTLRDNPSHPGKLALLPSGNRRDPDFAEYAKRVLSLDWSDFYQRRGGERFFDWLRQELLRPAPAGWDIVLIDSRTGVTEVGGVCTHHLPDLVVSFVATNLQNLEGAKMMAQSLANPSLVEKTRRGAPLHQLFVPSRVEISEEDLHDKFARRFDEELNQWFPSHLQPEKRSWFLDLKLIYVPAYAYNERVAVREGERASKVDLIDAYRRLASRITQVFGDTPLAAGQPEASLQVTNLPLRNSYFTGREEELKLTAACLAQMTPVILIGQGGIGKTCTAIEYAARARNEYNTVLFCRASSPEELEASCTEIVRLLGPGMRPGSPPRAVRAWLQENDRWLLILDYVSDAGLVESVLPPGLRGAVIFTTRIQGFCPLGARAIPITSLNASTSLEFLLRRLARTDVAIPERQAAEALAEELGGHPLALEQAAAYMAMRQTRIADYLASYRKRRLRLLDQQRAMSGGRELSLNAVFESSLAGLERSPESIAVLRFSSLLAPKEIPLELLVLCGRSLSESLRDMLSDAADDPLAVDDVLEPLTRASLVERNPSVNTYSVHPLLQEFVRSRMSQEELAEWRARALVGLKDVPPVTARTRPIWDRAWPHISILLEKDSESLAPATLVMRAGQYATLTGDKTTAEAFLMRAMRDARASSREEEIVEAQTLLAELRLSMGEAGEGVKLADDALETARRCMLSPDRVAPALLVSARCRTRDGRPREAEALLREILETQQAPKEVQVNAALELANNMWGKENERERESLLFRAVELAQAEPGSVLAVALLNLSNFYIFGAVHGGPAAPRRVEGDLRHALQTAEQNGADPRLLAPILEALGLYFLLGRDFRTADAFLRRALAEWRRINNDSGIAYTLGYLSIVLGELGRAEEARAMTDEAMLPAQQAGNADGLKFHLSSVAKAAGAERFGGVASSA